MKGTFEATGSTFTAIGGPGYIRGGQGKTAALSLNFGTGTVQLRRSGDNGTTWHIIESYTSDTEKLVECPSSEFIYDLNCSAYTADIDYIFSS